MAAKKMAENSNKESVKNDDILIEPATEEVAEGKKKAKKNKKEKKKKKSGGIIGKIVPVLVLLLVVGAIVAILGFNLFDIRDRYLRGVLKDIPIVSNLLPPETDEVTEDPYSGKTQAELIAEINQLTEEVESNQQVIQDMAQTIEENDAEIERLSAIEEQQIQYRNNKAEFDRLVTENDPAAYSRFYEGVSPENAAILYQQAIATVQNSKDIKKYVADFTAMEASSAAKILEQMLTTDMDLVTMIVGNMSSESAGAVLEAMDPQNAASVKKMLAPTPVPAMAAYPPTATDVPTETPEATEAP